MATSLPTAEALCATKATLQIYLIAKCPLVFLVLKNVHVIKLQNVHLLVISFYCKPSLHDRVS